MIGIIIAGSGAGSMVTPPLAGWLISAYSWRTSYSIIGIAVLVVIMVAAQFLKLDPAQMGLTPYEGGETTARGPNLNVSDFSLSEAVRTRQFWALGLLTMCFMFCQEPIVTGRILDVTGSYFPGFLISTSLAVIGLILTMSLMPTAAKEGNGIRPQSNNCPLTSL